MCKVLVIDDEGIILCIVKKALQRLDYVVETAHNGKNGIDKFDAGHYDLVITDISMPEADGNQVVDHIRNSRRNRTPVIGMSGVPGVLGNPMFDRVLPKPFQIDSLMQTARKLTSGTC